ncbi:MULTISPECIES: ECF transporter S component [Caproicibacterium]|jgi:hypothetical protein|uniref:ECF transporter S component n=1 Tax=Caproicibacterium lactatifermentans TaxID=2666138 RepID=A0A859DQF3_9FIRM|nr:ECF transporter S component [Caproicibacterium lactatifermentans]ARP50341.1 hypothetical protein B6259_05295 [Ruminococcaceae bacterium CPB6]QKN23936.1 ECF transporter S component [Caproicibacterium lactatifermentans]QKO30993.1 ECF transporter S component [Caproicibacterium lactatifermentans]
MTQKKETLWITQTAVCIALLVGLQAATAPLGSTILTGSIVNYLLVVSVMLCGVRSGCIVAVVSPIVAKLFGIGPLWALVPFIMAGNLVLVLLWSLIAKNESSRKFFRGAAAVVLSAVGKFLVLYFGIVKLAVPYILKLKGTKANVISMMFSYPQLLTAVIGGIVAALTLPLLKKAIHTHTA